MAHGIDPPGWLLPSQRELAAEFEVSRDTVQRALRELIGEGRVESRRGAGTRVVRGGQVPAPRARAATLRESLQRAFEQPEVTLDVFTLTAESLEAHTRLQAERIRAGEIAPLRIALRVLLPSESLRLPYWRTGDRLQDEALQERYLGLSRRYTASMYSVLRTLEAERLVSSVDLEIRRVWFVPQFELYLLNGVEALLGLYTAVRRTIVLDDGRETEDVLDAVAPAAGLIRYVKDGDPYSQETVSVNSFQDWFDSVRDHLAE